MGEVLAVSQSYPASWRQLAALPLLASEPWHRAMSGRLEGTPVWLSFEDGAAWQPGPTVGLAGYVVSDPDAYRYGNVAALVADPDSPFVPAAAVAALAGGAVDRPALFPHLLVSYPGYATFPVGRGSADRSRLRETLMAVGEWAAAAGIAAVALPYTAAGGELGAVATDLGYRSWPLTTESTLAITPGGFEDYLAGLPPRRRRKVRADRRTVTRHGLVGEQLSTVDSLLRERIVALRLLHRRRYGLPADPAAERSRLDQVLDLLGDRVTVFVTADPAAGGTVVCFALFVRDGTDWHGLYVGADYRDPRHRGAYFEVGFYLPVQAAPAAGICRISYGLGASAPKRWRGCQQEPVSCLLRSLTPRADAAAAGVDAAWRAASAAPPPGVAGPALAQGGEQG